MTNKPGDTDLPPAQVTPGTSLPLEQLRRQAEKRIREKTVEPEKIPASLSPQEMRETIHELRIHQIELEMQNEEMRRVQQELDGLRERYFDLFDLAPVGYLILSEKGLILESNLATATFLDTPRSALVQQPFSRFIHKDDQDIYYKHFKQLLKTEDPQSCELRMKTVSGCPLWGHLTVVRGMEKTEPVCRLTLHDITRLNVCLCPDIPLISLPPKGCWLKGLILSRNPFQRRTSPIKSGRYSNCSRDTHNIFHAFPNFALRNHLLLIKMIYNLRTTICAKIDEFRVPYYGD